MNCEDSPECGRWSRKQQKQSRSHTRNVAISNFELGSMSEDSEEEWEERPAHFEAAMHSELQDPSMDDGMALELALMQSREEAAVTSPSDRSIEQSADGEAHTGNSPQVLELGDLCSEATDVCRDDWDLLETASISSSWLDLDNNHTAEQVLEDEGMLVVGPGSAEAAVNKTNPQSFAEATKPQSFAQALLHGVGTTPARFTINVRPPPFHSKPHMERVLKPIPEFEEDSRTAWEMYKSLGGQRQYGRYGQQRRGRCGRKK